MLAPNDPSFGGKNDLINIRRFPYIFIFIPGGNRPPWAIKGDSLTTHKTTHFGEKKEKGRVHLRAIL